MNDIDNNYEDDMDYEDNTENNMDYESDIGRDNKCPRCGQGNRDYCKPCNSVHFRDNFAHWTSGDSNLDELIQNSQLNAYYSWGFIEWIEYSNLENIEFIAHGGFGSVYKAIWKDGPIINYESWNMNKHKWQREGETEVAVKKFRNATHVNSEFLNEVNITLKMNNLINYDNTIKIYGVTRDLQNGEYAIITDFKDGGNLREFIKKNHSELTWKAIITLLYTFIWTLDEIHCKDYYHKDLHSGNILMNSIYSNNCYFKSAISDFGLCRPMNLSSTDKTPYGILPFVAPEVLRGGEFTEVADIYGFGMIMLELIRGEPPFVDKEYDENLILAICYGQRPQIPEYTPEPYAALMKRCWDPIPANRPTTKVLYDEFRYLLNILYPDADESSEPIELDRDKSSELNEDESSKLNEDEPSGLNKDKSSELNEGESNEINEDESIELSEDESGEFSEEDSIEFSEDDFGEDVLEIKEAFSQEREDKWKVRLAELAANPIPLKKSQNLLTSKRLDFSHSLSQKLTVEDWNKLRLTD